MGTPVGEAWGPAAVLCGTLFQAKAIGLCGAGGSREQEGLCGSQRVPSVPRANSASSPCARQQAESLDRPAAGATGWRSCRAWGCLP